MKRIRLREWVLPGRTALIVYNDLAHTSEDNFPEAASSDPNRFVGASPPPFRWVPFGGRVNRCPGASFANMEMDVTLRTLFREFISAPTDAGQRRINHGVACVPSRGGGAVVYRGRTRRQMLPAPSR